MTANRTPPVKCLVGAHDNPAKAPEFCQYASNDHPISSSGAATALPKYVYRRNDQSYQIVGAIPIHRPLPTLLTWERGRPARTPQMRAGRPRSQRSAGRGAWLANAFRLVLDTVSRGL